MVYLADSDGPIFSVKVHAEPFLDFKKNQQLFPWAFFCLDQDDATWSVNA